MSCTISMNTLNKKDFVSSVRSLCFSLVWISKSFVHHSDYVKYLMDEYDYKVTLRNEVVSAREVFDNLSESIQNVYEDVMSEGIINAETHPEEFRLYHNPFLVTEGTWCVDFARIIISVTSLFLINLFILSFNLKKVTGLWYMGKVQQPVDLH